MSQFEFFLVLGSVVLAIGIAEIAGTWGNVLRSTATIRVDWIHIGWTIIALLNALVYWIGMWPYAEIHFVYSGQVFFLVIPSIFFVLLCFSLSPKLPDVGNFSFREYYLLKRKQIFLSYIAFLITSTIADIVISCPSTVFATSDMLVVGVITGLLVLLVIYKDMRLHGSVTVLMLIFYVFLTLQPLETIFFRFSQ
jgi:hypothetical protein